jgi:hypothetical protein
LWRLVSQAWDTPGALREEYFETLAQLAAGEVTMTEAEHTEFALHHDSIWI